MSDIVPRNVRSLAGHKEGPLALSHEGASQHLSRA